jgi:cellulose synthase/poly-beta-1,6-N-acetylglucosamine synthase-like glycosyltransferase
MLIYLILIFSIYFGFLLACILGWLKFTTQTKSNEEQTDQFVSVIIAFRNEEAALPLLLDSVKHQAFPVHQFEVVFVDDHSSDNSNQIILEWLKGNPHVRGSCINALGNGKKQALTEGIKSSRGEIVLTTDADVELPEDWMSTMAGAFRADTSMVMGLVKIQQSGSLFSKLQALEFSSLIGSGVAMNMLGYPVMCNGASLAFRRKSFEAVNGYEDNLHIPSGDDEFLMRKLKSVFREQSVLIRTRAPLWQPDLWQLLKVLSISGFVGLESGMPMNLRFLRAWLCSFWFFRSQTS